MKQRSCLVRPHYAGLFSLLNCVITCAEMFESVSVDWTDSLYSPDSNLWDALFLPTPAPDPEAVIISQYPHQKYTYKHAGELYQLHKAELGWRRDYRKQWAKITVRPEHLQTVLKVVWGLWKASGAPEYVGVLVRAHGHAGEQLTERSQAYEEYACAIEREVGPNERIFLMAGNNETLSWFAARFPKRVAFYEPTKRAESRDIDRHLTEPQTVQDAVNCLIEALVLSRARVIVHPVSNISTFSLGIGEAKSVFLP